MKCHACNERKGSTRCEGCGILFCLPCMNAHHETLMLEFQQLLHTRNEVKEAFDTVEASSKKGKTFPCLMQVDQWEHETVQRVQQVAEKARVNIRTILTENTAEVRGRLEALSTNMQQQQKEGIYLETDIKEVKKQLEELKKAISKMHGNIQVTTSDKIQWDALIGVNMWTDVPDATADDHWEPCQEQRYAVNHTKRQQRKLDFQTRASSVFQPEEPRSNQPISRPSRHQSNRYLESEESPDRNSNAKQRSDVSDETMDIPSFNDTPLYPGSLLDRIRHIIGKP